MKNNQFLKYGIYILLFLSANSLSSCNKASVTVSSDDTVVSHNFFYPGSTEWIFKQVDGKNLKMSVFLPDNYTDSEKTFPCIVIFHGGSWTEGDVSWHFPDCEYWSKRGIIAVSVDYRLKVRDNVVVPLECVKDAKSAIRFLRKNAKELKVDAEKIVGAGDSAGGQLAAATAMITDSKVNDDSYDLSISCIPNAVILWNPWFKCEKYLSPTYNVVKSLPPFIIFSGGSDPGIPVSEMVDFHESLKHVGNSSELYIGHEGKHGFCNGRNKNNRFFYWSLELEDQFLVKHGILSGTSVVNIPNGVLPLQENEYDKYD